MVACEASPAPARCGRRVPDPCGPFPDGSPDPGGEEPTRAALAALARAAGPDAGGRAWAVETIVVTRAGVGRGEDVTREGTTNGVQDQPWWTSGSKYALAFLVFSNIAVLLTIFVPEF